MNRPQPTAWPGSKTSARCGTFHLECETMLPNPGTTALDDDAEQNDENHSGNYAKDRYTVHFDLLSLNVRDGC
jgi:hypothetical protein